MAKVIYLLTEPPNTLEAKGRVLGNYPAHFNNSARRKIHEICQPLKDKGVQIVYSSDHDEEAGHIVASELNCPFQRESYLRRFNMGWYHGHQSDVVDRALDTLIGKWKRNLASPIRGGDSWLSIEKKLFKTFDRLMAKGETSVIVTDAKTATLIQLREPKALTMNGTGCKPEKIYMVNHARAN
jgi:hypothetical protein